MTLCMLVAVATFQVFVVHGGLSEEQDMTIADIERINVRFPHVPPARHRRTREPTVPRSWHV